MENEKEYIITIDGPDCTGKSTLWKKANEYNKNIQIRGILSNIAYGIKYGRNIKEMIDLYNENPVNYVVYLLNPINDKKLEMLYNRLRNNIYDNEFITKELSDISNTWSDYEYFEKAINILNEKYKGTIEVIKSKNNYFDEFKNAISNFKIKEINKSLESAGIKVINSTIDDFESKAKIKSEFKYIVLMSKFSKTEAIYNLYEGLDDNYKKMLDKLFEYSNKAADDVYDSLEELTIDSLINYLDNCELHVDVNFRVEIDTCTDIYIPLRDIKDDIESAIYDNDNIMNELYDDAKNNVYDNELNISVESVR